MKHILFNTEMVRAILENRKTVTRMVVKPQPEKSAHSPYECVGGCFDFRIRGCARTGQYKTPYRLGDILYVREVFAKPYGGEYRYRADYNDHDVILADRGDVSFSANMIKWRPSIHMPKEAARLFLRVTAVRVERLHYITRDEAIREGANPALAVDDFKRIWNSTIKKSELALYGWEANPYVFVIEFCRISKEEAKKNS